MEWSGVVWSGVVWCGVVCGVQAKSTCREGTRVWGVPDAQLSPLLTALNLSKVQTCLNELLPSECRLIAIIALLSCQGLPGAEGSSCEGCGWGCGWEWRSGHPPTYECFVVQACVHLDWRDAVGFGLC